MNKIEALKYLLSNLDEVNIRSSKKSIFRNYKVLTEVINTEIEEFFEIELDWMITGCKSTWYDIDELNNVKIEDAIRKTPIHIDYVYKCINDIKKFSQVSDDSIDIIEKFIDNPSNLHKEVINIIEYEQEKLGWIPIINVNGNYAINYSMTDPKVASCLMLNTIKNYINQEFNHG